MRRFRIAVTFNVVACLATTAVVGTLAETGGQTTGVEAAAMTVVGAVTVAAIIAVALWAGRRP